MTDNGGDFVDFEAEELRGFDDYELTLGDRMRGERATYGLSLLDVQRELRIKAEFLAAIEDCNPAGFDSPGFIAGYVRSYARFLRLDPEEAFAQFCRESGFSRANNLGLGESGAAKVSASNGKPKMIRQKPGLSAADMALAQSFSSLGGGGSRTKQMDPGALGSAAVLVALIAGLGYGGWSVLQELQRVNVVPVEAAPDVVASIDPLDGALNREPRTIAAVGGNFGGGPQPDAGQQGPDVSAPTMDALDRLYRPPALATPVLTARDGPIAAIDPRTVGGGLASVSSGHGASLNPDIDNASLDVARLTQSSSAPSSPRVLADGAPEVAVVAVAPAWVRIRAADGTILLEKIMEAGERFALPATEEPPVLRAGASGSVFFMVGDEAFGPAGAAGSVANGIVLGADALRGAYQMADLNNLPDLAAIVNVAEAATE